MVNTDRRPVSSHEECSIGGAGDGGAVIRLLLGGSFILYPGVWLAHVTDGGVKWNNRTIEGVVHVQSLTLVIKTRQGLIHSLSNVLTKHGLIVMFVIGRRRYHWTTITWYLNVNEVEPKNYDV